MLPMISKPASYWHGEPLSQLSRAGLETAAECAIAELVMAAERERLRTSFDVASLAFLGGALLAGLGAIVGISLAG